MVMHACMMMMMMGDKNNLNTRGIRVSATASGFPSKSPIETCSAGLFFILYIYISSQRYHWFYCIPVKVIVMILYGSEGVKKGSYLFPHTGTHARTHAHMDRYTNYMRATPPVIVGSASLVQKIQTFFSFLLLLSSLFSLLSSLSLSSSSSRVPLAIIILKKKNTHTTSQIHERHASHGGQQTSCQLSGFCFFFVFVFCGFCDQRTNGRSFVRPHTARHGRGHPAPSYKTFVSYSNLEEGGGSQIEIEIEIACALRLAPSRLPVSRLICLMALYQLTTTVSITAPDSIDEKTTS